MDDVTAPLGAGDVTVIDDVFGDDGVGSFEDEYLEEEVNGTDGVYYDIPYEYLDGDVTLIDDVDTYDDIHWTDDVDYDNDVTLTDDMDQDYDVTHTDEPISAWNDDVTSPNGPISSRNDDDTSPDGPISARDPPTDATASDRDQRGAAVLLSGPRASSNHVMALSHQRAACMWADLGHFLASCSVLHNLIAICEYTPEET